MAMVQTTLGEVDESELEILLVPQPSEGNVWVTARECRYKGLRFPDRVGELVKRSVWVDVKSGLAAQVAASL